MHNYDFIKTLREDKNYLYKHKKSEKIYEVIKISEINYFPKTNNNVIFLKEKEVFKVQNNYWVILPYYKNKSLFSIDKNNNFLEETYLCLIFKNIIQIINTIHLLKLSCLNFDLNNFFINKKGDFIIKNSFEFLPFSEKEGQKDLDNFHNFIFRLSKIENIKKKDLCVSRKFKEFINIIENFYLNPKIKTNDKILKIQKQKFLCTKNKKIILLDLFEEEDSISSEENLSLLNLKKNDKIENSSNSAKPLNLNKIKSEENNLDSQKFIECINEIFKNKSIYLKKNNEFKTTKLLQSIKTILINIENKKKGSGLTFLKNYLKHKNIKFQF